jgi:preprotein translocase subunit YajC
MSDLVLSFIPLLQGTPESPAPGGPSPGFFQQFNLFFLFAIFIAIMYFLVIRPQKKREAERQKMLSSLRKNDRVLTTGGVYGTVMGLKDDEVVLRVDDSQNVRLRVARNAISEITSRGDDEES